MASLTNRLILFTTLGRISILTGRSQWPDIDSTFAHREHSLNFSRVDFCALHFAAIVCSFTQTHTAFLSPLVSFASGCIRAYVRGGILPVDTSPQTPWQDRARRESTVLRTHHRSRQGVKRFAVGVLPFRERQPRSQVLNAATPSPARKT